MKHYFQDVKTLSDDELKALSAEINEAYGSTNDDGDECWLNGEAEHRYYQMQAELNRREWDRLSPEEQEQRSREMKMVARVVVESLSKNLIAAKSVDRDYVFAGSKIGASLKIRRPERFNGVTG